LLSDFNFLLFTGLFSDMMKGKQLADYEKGQIDAYRANGDGYGTIAKAVGRSKGAVQNYVTKRRGYGKKKSSGRPKKLSKRDERAIGRAASNSNKSTTDIKRELNLDVCRETVRLAIKRNLNIVRAKMMKAPKMNAGHKAARLKFARQNMARDWIKVRSG
jgi:transposase